MGGTAFASLMVAELCLSVLAFGRPVSEHFDAYRSMPALLGLAAQIAFAAFPLIREPHRRRLDRSDLIAL